MPWLCLRLVGTVYRICQRQAREIRIENHFHVASIHSLRRRLWCASGCFPSSLVFPLSMLRSRGSLGAGGLDVHFSCAPFYVVCGTVAGGDGDSSDVVVGAVSGGLGRGGGGDEDAAGSGEVSSGA